MTPEGKVTAAIVRELKRRKARGESIFWLKIHGGPMQRAGVPDLVVIYRGQTYWVEIKAPGGRATPFQLYTIQSIVDAGGVAAVVTTLPDFCSLLWDDHPPFSENLD
jgi:hypothetical protein